MDIKGAGNDCNNYGATTMEHLRTVTTRAVVTFVHGETTSHIVKFYNYLARHCQVPFYVRVTS